MNKYDFNDIAAMLRNGTSDEDIASAFTKALNDAKTLETKRKAEEAAAKELEAKKQEEARFHREKSMKLATDAATALNAFLVHEGILSKGEACFSGEDLINFIDEAKKEIDSLVSLLKPLSLPQKNSKRLSDDDIFDILFSKIF